MELIDGKDVASRIRAKLKIELEDMKTKPNLVVILVGNDPASQVYVNMKEKDTKEIGMRGKVIKLPENISQNELEAKIIEFNKDQDVHGILLQLPIPSHLDENQALNLISPDKDVDGLHDVNVGKLNNRKDGLRPCTPSGIIELLKAYNVEITGKHAVVIGRSKLVGKPIARMLEQENATVTVLHSKSNPLEYFTRQADILVAAAGKAKLIKKNMLKTGVTVIDVGIHRIDGKLVGDVDFEDVKDIVSKITPVPGGVGPMTRAMLLVNTLKACKTQLN